MLVSVYMCTMEASACIHVYHGCGCLYKGVLRNLLFAYMFTMGVGAYIQVYYGCGYL